LAVFVAATIEVVATALVPLAEKEFMADIMAKNWPVFVEGAILYGIFLIFIVSAMALKSLSVSLMTVDLGKNLVSSFLKFPGTRGSVIAPGRIDSDGKTLAMDVLSLATETYISAGIVVALLFQITRLDILGLAIVYMAIYFFLTVIFKKRLSGYLHLVRCGQDKYRAQLEKREAIKEGMVLRMYGHMRAAVFKLQITTLWFRVVNKGGCDALALLPFFLLVPEYIAGTMDFPTMAAAYTSFRLLVINFGIILTLYPTYTEARVAYKRLETLWASLSN
jgi:ABC-type uncharacterized transport system fused permease/ATPase subunit